MVGAPNAGNARPLAKITAPPIAAPCPLFGHPNRRNLQKIRPIIFPRCSNLPTLVAEGPAMLPGSKMESDGMSETTPTIGLPYILPSQAQKHVTHNLALQRIDAAAQLVVTATLDTPPAAADEGDCYAVGSNPTDAWSNRSGTLAVRQDGAWLFLEPRPGWRAFMAEEGELRIFDGASWSPLPLPGTARLERLGIGTDADDTNRLAVSGPASLLTHAGGSHRLAINKKATGDSATLIFQSDWSGRAEIGLAGDDRFSLKVSDGESWRHALAVGEDGVVDLPGRPFVRAGLSLGLRQPADNSQSGFDTLYLGRGFTLGDNLASGLGRNLVVPHAGYYCLVLTLTATSTTAFACELRRNATETIATISAAPATSPSLHTLSTIGWLESTDTLSLHHSGAASIQFSYGKSEFCAHLI